MMSKFMYVGENTSCTGLEAFHKVCVEGEGLYISSSINAQDSSLSDWKCKFIHLSVLYTFHSTLGVLNSTHNEKNVLILDNYENKII